MTTKFVLKDECDKNIHMSKGMIIISLGIFFSLMTLFLTLVGFSVSEAHAAANNSRKSTEKIQIALEESKSVAQILQIHLQVSIAKEQASLEKLEDIRIELKLQRQEQQIIYKKLLELEILITARKYD